MSASLNVFLPLQLTRRGPSYTCGVLSRGMAGPDLDIRIVTPRTRLFPVHPAKVVQTLPHLARYLPYGYVKARALDDLDARFLSVFQHRAATPAGAYIWPDAKMETIRELKRNGVVVFREMINCCLAAAKQILDDAYARMGVAPLHSISDASAENERERLEAVDYIFCPNAMVEQTLLANGVPQSKLLAASYGWEPARFSRSRRRLKPAEGATFVFVGDICVRKGCHLLLDYWASSGVRGRLVLVGDVEPVIREQCAKLLARDDVVVLDFARTSAPFTGRLMSSSFLRWKRAAHR